MFLKNQNINKHLFCHCHCHLIYDPGSAFYDHFRGGEAPSEVIVICRSRMKDQVAMAVADNLVVTKNQPKIFGPFILHQVRLCTKFIFYTKFEATPSSLSVRIRPPTFISRVAEGGSSRRGV